MDSIFRVSAVGVTIGIDLTGLEPADADAVRAAWADARAEAGDPVETVVPMGGDRSVMLMALSQQVTLAAIAAQRGRLWMLHAAGVATEDGDVVVFVGPSGRGKTTVARALGAAYAYLSDETIGIEADGRVRVYRKPLSIIEEQSAPKAERAPSSVGLRSVPDADLRARAIVLLERDTEHVGAPVVRDVDLADALGDLVAQTSFLPDLAAPLQTIVEHSKATGGIRAVVYREAADLAPLVPALVRTSPLAHAEAAPVDPSTLGSAAAAPDASAVSRHPLFSRAEVIDSLAFADPERIALLSPAPDDLATLHVIAGIGPALWRAADAATLDDLCRAAVAAYGRPEGQDPAEVVGAAVRAMVDEGVLRADDGSRL